jgi:hypothetical protein
MAISFSTQWINGLGLLLGLAQIPVFQQLSLMQFRPIQNQLSRPSWQGAVTNAQPANIDRSLEFAISGMEVRRCVFVPEHLDQDAVEDADGGHGSTLILL